ncbi:MAG: APC family permease [Alphaproteobacteria bacterium]
MSPAADPAPPAAPATLRRVLGLWILVFYGLGSIVGAGIYVLIGAVAGVAGYGAPLAFVGAGVLAGLTGLSYAELSARYPEAAGAAAYVQEGFGRAWLSRLVGFAVVAVGLFLTGSLAHGVVGYLNEFLAVPPLPAALAVVVLFTAIACVGVGQSLMLAAVMTAVEIGGLAIVAAVGAPALARLPEVAPLMVPGDVTAMLAVTSGIFLAFFAFLGFEDIVNMAEETRAPERTLPRAVLLSILFATVIYGVIAVVAVVAVPLGDLAASRAPLELIMGRAEWVPHGLLSVIALIAIPNGILITLVMLGRILYGMARRGWLPAALGVVNPWTRTPLRTTVIAGGLAVAFTASVDFIGLVTLTSAVNLCVFAVVNLALWRLHRSNPRPDLPIRAWPWCPPLAAGICAALIALKFVG